MRGALDCPLSFLVLRLGSCDSGLGAVSNLVPARVEDLWRRVVDGDDAIVIGEPDVATVIGEALEEDAIVSGLLGTGTFTPEEEPTKAPYVGKGGNGP